MSVGSKHVRNTKTTNKRYKGKNLQFSTGMLTFVAAFMGVAIGFAASLAVVVPMVHAEFADQTKQLSQRIVSMTPASTTVADACSQPTSVNATPAPSGQVLGAETAAAVTPATTPNNSSSVPANVFVTKLVGGQLARNTATISNTGENSANTVESTNTNKTTEVSTTNIAATNSTVQSATSGAATVENNNTGGNVTTGGSSNTATTSTTIDIRN